MMKYFLLIVLLLFDKGFAFIELVVIKTVARKQQENHDENCQHKGCKAEGKGPFCHKVFFWFTGLKVGNFMSCCKKR